ncbi:MAG: hypothetical protein IJS15_01165 [Victivallales bacterium]|nr:hypothetical protein [Victivallales bacterium]
MLSLDTDNFSPASQASSHLAIHLDGMFQRYAVLQQGRTVPVTGQASPGAFVKVTLSEACACAMASDDGRFTAFLPPLPPADGLVLRVESGGSVVEITDVAVGEVVLASGQSNMEFPLDHCRPGSKDMTPEDFEGIRFFKVPLSTAVGEQRSLQGKWALTSPEEAGRISGATFFYARALRRETGRVIGFIDASRGGTSIEAWLSRESLAALPECRDDLFAYEAKVSSPDKYPDCKVRSFNDQLDDALKALFPTIPADNGEAEGYANEFFDDSSWQSMSIPDSWTQSGHNHAGIFWFRRKIDLDAREASQPCTLHLGAIDKADRVFVNGTLVGATGDGIDMGPWCKLRVYDVPKGLLRQGANTLSVQALSFESICEDGGLLGPAEEMYLESGGTRIPLAGTWKYKCTYNAGVEGMTCMRDFGAGASTSFHILYDNLIAPLGQIPLSSIIWYQGEADAICLAHRYRACLSELIQSWRRRFCEANLPFIVVQLPDYHNPHAFAPHSQWARIREAQFQAAKSNGADCVVTLGTGDVTELHCLDKESLGERAARFAIARMQGRAVSGPIPRNFATDGPRVIIDFDPAFPLDTTTEPPKCFAITDEHGNSAIAHVAFESDTRLAVWADGIAEPHTVWYAWGDNPVGATLRGVDGLPASPFRVTVRKPNLNKALLHIID